MQGVKAIFARDSAQVIEFSQLARTSKITPESFEAGSRQKALEKILVEDTGRSLETNLETTARHQPDRRSGRLEMQTVRSQSRRAKMPRPVEECCRPLIFSIGLSRTTLKEHRRPSMLKIEAICFQPMRQ